MSEAMLEPALLDLMEHEKVIEQGLETFLEVGHALLAIRDDRKYRAAGFESFERYCRERWEMSKAYANRVIDAARVAELVAPMGAIAPPRTERVIRELAPLAREDPELARDTWARAHELAPSGHAPTAANVREAVAEARAPRMGKPALGPYGVAHPARFLSELLPAFARALDGATRVLDPFAGTGRIHELRASGFETYGIELEPEWAACSPYTAIGDATALPYPAGSFDAVCTSPTYGNRFADHHEARDASFRRSYTFDLGRELSPGNAGAMQWGPAYRELHVRAWQEAWRVLRPGGRFVLNVKDHVRAGAIVPVSGWHITTLCRLGFAALELVPVVTAGIPLGENADLRTRHEWIFVLAKEEASA